MFAQILQELARPFWSIATTSGCSDCCCLHSSFTVALRVQYSCMAGTGFELSYGKSREPLDVTKNITAQFDK